MRFPPPQPCCRRSLPRDTATLRSSPAWSLLLLCSGGVIAPLSRARGILIYIFLCPARSPRSNLALSCSDSHPLASRPGTSSSLQKPKRNPCHALPPAGGLGTHSALSAPLQLRLPSLYSSCSFPGLSLVFPRLAPLSSCPLSSCRSPATSFAATCIGVSLLSPGCPLFLNIEA